MSRLSAVEGEQSGRESFAYDPAGNLLAVGNGRQSYRGRAKGDRLFSLVTPEVPEGSALQYAYDGHGNRLERTTPEARITRYRYDASHQLASIEHEDGTTSRYEYDALGRRIAKHTNAQGSMQTTLFVWDGDWMAQEVRVGSGVQGIASVTYVAHPNHAGPLTKLEGGEVSHYVTDHLGTPQEMYDGKRQVVWAAEFNAYGKTRSMLKREVENPIRFPGQFYDAESGLHYNLFRYYDAQAGRYINQDPIGLAGGTNQYAYAEGNPVQMIDPSGEAALIPIVVGASLGEVTDYFLSQWKEQHCKCTGAKTALGSAGNAGLGAANGTFGPFARKPRTGIAGGGRAGTKTSAFSTLAHELNKRKLITTGTTKTMRKLGRTVAKKIPYVSTAVIAYEIYDAYECQ
jgi:type VI secretion system secreted protein VgrG